MDKSDSTRPGPLVFIPYAVASRLLPRLLRALPAQPSREAAFWGWMAARDQACPENVSKPDEAARTVALAREQGLDPRAVEFRTADDIERRLCRTQN